MHTPETPVPVSKTSLSSIEDKKEKGLIETTVSSQCERFFSPRKANSSPQRPTFQAQPKFYFTRNKRGQIVDTLVGDFPISELSGQKSKQSFKDECTHNSASNEYSR